ncbi:DUF7059 domain-containing protein [Nesterenkonia populi]|uniref:DUF7059 domain-containing protein n=1 Tax=Nesterenkonia populi TaxID=1591087 RepID=UPI0011BDF96C|nr:methyltransferase [Nesterenkonia populi]
MPETSPAPPSCSDLELIAALREDLAAANFTNDGVAQLLGTEAVGALDREQVVPGQLRILELLEDPSPQHGRNDAACAALTALWLVSVEVTAEQIDAALPRTRTQGLVRLGLAEITGPGPEDTAITPQEGPHAAPSEAARERRRVRPSADLRPYQVQGGEAAHDLWVTSDLSAHQVSGALPHDHVLGVGQASLTLAAGTHRRPVGSALDIGTGCGIQLLHLLDHAEHVVGTDVSERALVFARFNLLLNAPALSLDPHRLEDRVELLHGSLLEPAAGRTFDLVVSNPPFVITPRTGAAEEERYVYRDGGREGDTLMAELITGIPEVLNSGAAVQMLGNWEVPAAAQASASASTGTPSAAEAPDGDTFLRPRQWAERSGLSAWFIQRDLQTPPQYAETWLRDASEERDLAEYRRRYAAYLRDFEQRGVQGVGFGMIWLSKPRVGQEAWRRFEELTGEVQQPLGPVIGQTAARAAEDPESLLAHRLTVAGDVTEERYQRFGSEHPEVIIARQGAGLRRARPISSAAAGFMAASDGELAAGQIITAVCALTDADDDSLKAEVLDLYVDGYLNLYSEAQPPSSRTVAPK